MIKNTLKNIIFKRILKNIYSDIFIKESQSKKCDIYSMSTENPVR